MPRSSRARSRSGARASRSPPVGSTCATRRRRVSTSLRRAKQTTGLEIHALVLGEHNESGGLADENADVCGAARDDVRDAIAWAHRARSPGHPRPVLHARGAGERSRRGPCGTPRFARSVRSPPSGVSRSATRGRSPPRRSSRSRLAWARTRSACYFDLANPLAKRGLDVPTEIRALGPLIRRVHVKDTRVRAGDCRPGTGRVDFAECARALSEIGYDGWLTLETPPLRRRSSRVT